jgi:hypothetical protein
MCNDGLKNETQSINLDLKRTDTSTPLTNKLTHMLEEPKMGLEEPSPSMKSGPAAAVP